MVEKHGESLIWNHFTLTGRMNHIQVLGVLISTQTLKSLLTLTLGGGGVQGQGKGQRLMTTFGWQHAKVESTKSNPPTPLGSNMLSC